MKLTNCQEKALEIFKPLFDEDSEFRVGVLTGSAGTGKTFLTAYLIKELEEEGWNVKVLTPTGRAAQIISDKMKPYSVNASPQTIHSLIYKIEPVDYTSGQLSIFGSTQVQSEEEKTVFIIDEGSMVGNEKKERSASGFNFGSGSLLHDFFEFADLDNRDDSRILFVGDTCQLPPISKNSNQTPALNLDKLSESMPQSVKNRKVLSAELITILRQGEGTLLEFVGRVRDSIRLGYDLPKKEVEDVRNMRESDMVKTYLQETDFGNLPKRAIILAHTNKAVYQYNRIIRESLGRSNELITVNEILLVKRNVSFRDFGELGISNDAATLKNGTFIQVANTPYALKDKEVKLKGGISVILKFFSVNIKFLDSDSEFEVTILANALLDGEHNISSEAKRKHTQNVEIAILVDFQNRMLEEYSWRPQKPSDEHYEAYNNAAKSDRFMNAIRVNYGYAVTVHNAQGGEWPIVIVDPASNYTRELQHYEDKRISFARWVYTASTRASEKLYFLKPEE